MEEVVALRASRSVSVESKRGGPGDMDESSFLEESYSEESEEREAGGSQQDRQGAPALARRRVAVDSDDSKSSDGCSVDQDALAAAEDRLRRGVAEAEKMERQAVAEAERDATFKMEEMLRQKEAEARSEMQEKLAKYQEMMQAEMQDKIKIYAQLAEKTTQERLRTAKEEARTARERQEAQLRADVSNASRKVRESQEEKRKMRMKRRNERDLREAMQKRDHERARRKRRQNHIELGCKTARAPRRRRGALRSSHRESTRTRVRLSGRDAARRGRHAGGGRRRGEHGADVHSEGGSEDDSRAPDDSRGRGRNDRREVRKRRRTSTQSQGLRAGPIQRELDGFRDRYPMEDSAFQKLKDAPLVAQREFLDKFKAKRDGEDDYSGLVVTFLRRVVERIEQQGWSGNASDRGGRGGGGRGRRGGNDRGDAYEKRRDDSRARLQDRSGSDGYNGGRGREGSPLSDFRRRYPMKARAFSVLESTAPDVQRTVINEFKPRREGDDDYTALVLAFVKSVTLRIESANRGSEAEDSLDGKR